MADNKHPVYEENFNILTSLTAYQDECVIWEPKPFTHILGIMAYYSGFLQSLRAKIKIRSLPEVPVPILEPESSRLERFSAFREMEWNNPRVEIGLILNVNGYEEEIHRFSAQKRLPFYGVDVLPYLDSANPFYLLSPNTSLKARAIDVGFGPLDADDAITFYGSAQGQIYIWEGLYPQPENDFANNGSVFVGDTSSLVAWENSYRKSLTIVNIGSEPCFLNLQREAVWGTGILLNPGGGSYSITAANLWMGMITAIAQTGKVAELGISEVSRSA